MEKITIISENHIDLKLLLAYIKEYNIEYIETENKIPDFLGDLVIVDAESFNCKGYEICKNIKLQNKHIPVILMCNAINIEPFEYGANDFLLKPINEKDTKDRVNYCIELSKIHKETILSNKDITDSIKEINQSVNYPKMQAIIALSNLAQLKDDPTGSHLERLQKYTYILSKEAKKYYPNDIDDDFIKNITIACMFHDIGKIGIPNNILLKPNNVSKEEMEIIKTHTIIGEETLDNIIKQYGGSDFLEISKLIAKSHHERTDGAGYPENLIGNEIPLPARIFTIADVYDSMRTKKPYKPAISHENCVKYIKENINKQFDEKITNAFLNISDQFNSIWLEYSSSF